MAVYEKFVHSWLAYPHAPPLTKDLPPLELAPNLFYPSAFESVATTMECSMISSHNIVRLLLSRNGYDLRDKDLHLSLLKQEL